MIPSILFTLLPLALAVPTPQANPTTTPSTLTYAISWSDNLCDNLMPNVTITPGQCADLNSRSHTFGGFVPGTDYPCASCQIATYSTQDCSGTALRMVPAAGYRSGCVAYYAEQGASVQLVC